MKAPVRWKDSEVVEPAMRELFRAGRRTEPLPPASRQRGARHAAALALVPVLSVGLWSKGVIAAFGVGFGGALALVSVSPALRAFLEPSPPAEVGALARAPSPPAVVTTPPAVVNAPPASVASAPLSKPVVDAARAARERKHSYPIAERRGVAAALPELIAAVAQEPVAEPARAGISAELELLLVARRRLATDAAAALLLLDQHRAAFPGGTLAMEREVLAVEALAGMGQREAAREKANALLAKSENGFYAGRLKQLLDSPR